MSVVMVLVGLSITGCGGAKTAGTVSGQVRESTEASLQAGLKAYEAKNWAEVEAKMTAALAGSGLNADMMVDAYLKRAEARLNTGNIPGAEQDLGAAAEGADPKAISDLRKLIDEKK